MKWIRPSGTEIETNDEEATVKHCKSMGWEPVEVEAARDENPPPWQDAGEELTGKQAKQTKKNRR